MTANTFDVVGTTIDQDTGVAYNEVEFTRWRLGYVHPITGASVSWVAQPATLDDYANWVECASHLVNSLETATTHVENVSFRFEDHQILVTLSPVDGSRPATTEAIPFFPLPGEMLTDG